MQSSELRAILEELEAKHGDLEVMTYQADHSWEFSTNRVEFQTEDGNHKEVARFSIIPEGW